ncbi:hypothetical protein LTS08_005130 [Lithohypha guttulata]|nr:hypothetical protein LTS08_005130 [Lithohypha guttulata]
MEATLLQPAASLPSLPDELINQILDSLTNKDLKALRLTARRLLDSTTARIFKHFKLYPHQRSFERLDRICTTPRLQPLITRLTYDASYVLLTEGMRGSIQWLWKHDTSDDGFGAKKKKNLKHADFLNNQTIYSNRAIDNLWQLTRLESALARLPHLQSVVVVDPIPEELSRHGDIVLDELPDFYAKLVEEMCGCDPTLLAQLHLDEGDDQISSSYAHTVLLAAQKLVHPLRSLTLLETRWEHLLQGSSTNLSHVLGAALCNLTSLKIVSADGMPDYTGRELTDRLCTILSRATNLNNLHLAFGRSFSAYRLGNVQDRSMFQPDQQERDYYEPVSAQLTFSSSLRDLMLKDLVCTSTEMKRILLHCAVSLESLYIHSLTITPEERDGPRSCLVDLIKWMQQNLNLKNIVLEGKLTNCGMQDWRIDHNHKAQERCPTPIDDEVGETTNLSNQVEQFILQTDSHLCPLNHLTIEPGYFDFRREFRETPVPHDLIDLAWTGNENFRIVYDAQRYDRQMLRQPYDSPVYGSESLVEVEDEFGVDQLWREEDSDGLDEDDRDEADADAWDEDGFPY